MSLRIFIDTDVIISSIISEKGVAYLLLKLKSVCTIISNYSIKEVSLVSHRLGLDSKKVKSMLSKCEEISLGSNVKSLEEKYTEYVNDLNDTHVVAGAVRAKARFLITYNIRDYNVEKIKRKLSVITLTPGEFIQYLRSQDLA